MLASIRYRACLSRNGYVSKEGTREVVIDIYQFGGLRATVRTALKVRQEDFANGKVQPSEPNYDLYNRSIRRLIRRLMEHEDELEGLGMACTPQRIKSAYLNHQIRSATLSEWVASVIEPSKRKSTTKSSYHSLIKNIEEFQSGTTISDICYDYIERWENWMRNQKKLKENTIIGKLKALKCLVNEAIKRDVISLDQNPFKSYQIPEMTAKEESLTFIELKRLICVKLDDSILDHIRDAFLFCCFTGIRWSDFKALTSSSIQGKALVINQQKTGKDVRIPLDTIFWGRALQLIEKYGTVDQLAKIGGNSFCNTKLRIIAEKAGVKKHCHWHLSRHTCGTLLNQKGLRMQEIQHILGHQKQETTEKHYAQTAFEQVKKSVRKAFKKEKTRQPE